MPRKTVEIAFLVERTNSFLETSVDEDKEMRVGMSALLEAVLFRTDTYKGFNFLSSQKNDDGSLILESEGLDESRRRYYL